MPYISLNQEVSDYGMTTQLTISQIKSTWENIQTENQYKYKQKLKNKKIIYLDNQVMVTLRFLANGDFLSKTADIHGISKASASRCIEEVTSSICKRLNNIKLPKGNAEIDAIKEGFYTIHAIGFPNVYGAVDGTLIPLQRPHEDEHAYVCRKGFSAINVQAIANSNLR
ncbi:unnamed protein product [Mytilus coruscus]|uniref:HARBI1 n=1 Tax=Mytilus coruscus TaxID=42192 RepID=A0A6J8F3A6_MYTCO|nr:unnamed protein product [Mytilus coruscus]